MYYDFWFDIEHVYDPIQFDAFGNQYAFNMNFDACRADASTNVLSGPKAPPSHCAYTDDDDCPF